MTAPNLELYWVSGSPYAWRALLTFEVIGLTYTSHLLEISKGDLATEAYRTLNSRGTVPTLTHGDFVLTESLAIMVYLDRIQSGKTIFGKDKREAGAIWQRISEFSSYLRDSSVSIVKAIYEDTIGQQKDKVSEALPRLCSELAVLEQALGPQAWLAGQAISAADIAIYPFMKSLARATARHEGDFLKDGPFPLNAHFPALAEWMRRIEQFPGYARTFPPHWAAPEPPDTSASAGTKAQGNR
jgi:glutathione S-transferase